jgi:hypothetical protein
LQTPLPLRRIFEAPTIAELAADVARVNGKAAEPTLEQILIEVEALTDEEAALLLPAGRGRLTGRPDARASAERDHG